VAAISNVKLEYSLDNGQTWIDITASTPNDGEHLWTIPNVLSNNCLVRISDAGDGDLSDTSNAVFAIVDEIVALIVDNVDAGFRKLSGNWHSSVDALSYGGGLQYSYASSALAQWQVDLPAQGEYEVSIYFGRFRYGGRKDAIYRVFHADGQSDFNFNQNDDSLIGEWHVLGEFQFNGSQAKIQILRGEDGPILADAVRLQKARTHAKSRDAVAGVPSKYRISQNYPNPFNLETQIRFEMPESGKVRLQIYNILGELVRTLLDVEMTEGVHQLIWDGRNEFGEIVSPGIYVCHFGTGDFSGSIKMIMLK
jgi:hypothetical protein